MCNTKSDIPNTIVPIPSIAIYRVVLSMFIFLGNRIYEYLGTLEQRSVSISIYDYRVILLLQR